MLNLALVLSLGVPSALTSNKASDFFSTSHGLLGQFARRLLSWVCALRYLLHREHRELFSGPGAWFETLQEADRVNGFDRLVECHGGAIHPYGYRLLLFPFEILGSRVAMENIVEWHSPSFHHLALMSLSPVVDRDLLGFLKEAKRYRTGRCFILDPCLAGRAKVYSYICNFNGAHTRPTVGRFVPHCP